MTLIWNGSPTSARSFSAFGGPLPPLFFVNFTDSTSSDVAVTPKGIRIFAGLNHPPGDSNYVAYQRFAPDGTPLGPMRPAQAPRHALFGNPRIAADRFGNFVIAWGSQPTIFCDRLEARLFRADGTPVGKEFFTSLDGEDACEGNPQVSFGEDGTFAISWVDLPGVSVAWFSASPGDEPCLTRGGRLLCDTGRTGGLPEIDQPDAPAAFDALFLADFDGDGRADLCLFKDGVFTCDLGHHGGAPDLIIHFGQTGDIPVLGDYDGDGRADPCILRGRTLRCDLKHDGGTAEAILKLAVQPGDGIVMGNLDGL
jgi:hypothetical protein